MKTGQKTVGFPIKRQIPGSNGQYYVRCKDKDEWCKILQWLNKNNYDNVHNLTENAMPTHPNIVVIDRNEKNFGRTNITCMACASMKGYYAIMFDEFYIRYYQDKDVLTVDIQPNSLNIFCQDLDLRGEDASYHYCFKLTFKKQNKEQLINLLLDGAERTDLNFLKQIDKFYFGSHVEDWFELEEFENLCKEHKIQYYKRKVKLKKHGSGRILFVKQ